MFPFPSDTYMRLLSEALFGVSYLEWRILADLPRLTDPPLELSSEALSRSPIGTVVKAVRLAASKAVAADERMWLGAAAEALEAVLEARNQVCKLIPLP